MKKFIFLLLAPLALAGCAQLGAVQQSGADKVADGVTRYCSNTDANFRAQFRADVNRQAAPHSIRVECN